MFALDRNDNLIRQNITKAERGYRIWGSALVLPAKNVGFLETWNSLCLVFALFRIRARHCSTLGFRELLHIVVVV